MTHKDIIDYWRNPDNEPPPEKYITKLKRSQKLAKTFQEIVVRPSDRILEIGCNVGRNLNHLYECGYTNLEGIEISQKAIVSLRETYPNLKDIQIFCMPVESFNFEDHKYDVIFTMAVLQHIHPDGITKIIEGMMHSAQKFIVTVEDERRSGPIHFKRNYGKIIDGNVFEQVHETSLSAKHGLPKRGFKLRVFWRRNL